MHYLSKLTKGGCALLLTAALLTGCIVEAASSPSKQPATPQSPTSSTTPMKAMAFDYQVDPESFSLSLEVDGISLSAANAMPQRAVTKLKEANGATSWVYPDEQISIAIEPAQDHLSVAITSDSAQDAAFAWPQISADEYYIPLGEGKRIPANDKVWNDYLGGKELSVLEQLSMPFWASSMGEYAVVYSLKHPSI